MGTVRIATIVLMIIAAPVFAASTVSYEVQLGGDNYADSIKACTRVAYKEGSAANGQTFYRADPLNWAAKIAVSGNQSQPGHPSDGLPTQGVANFVINLELHQGTADGPLVTNVSYYSSIHDGTGGSGTECTTLNSACPPADKMDKRAKGGYTIPTPTAFCAGAAFAYVFNVMGWGPGMVLESYSPGYYTGPYMEVGMYPTVDLGKISGEGQLLGVGAGYGQWNRGGGYSALTTRGVGIPVANGGIGLGPVVEGQIDVSQLAAGTYVLVLTPGTGHNVLRGDVNLDADPSPNPQVQAFAVPANQTAGDTITFILTDPVPLELLSVKAMRMHGTSEFGLQFHPHSTTVVECRSGAVSKIVATFNQTVFCTGGSCCSGGLCTSVGFFAMNDPDSYISDVSVNGPVVTITLANQDAVSDIMWFSFPGIQDDRGGIVSDGPCLLVLAGDVNASGVVSTPDLVSCRGKFGQALTDSNFWYDVNTNGSIGTSDLVFIRGKFGNNVEIGYCP